MDSHESCMFWNVAIESSASSSGDELGQVLWLWLRVAQGRMVACAASPMSNLLATEHGTHFGKLR